MDGNTKTGEWQELVEIYNSLPPPLQKQLLTLARVIDTTQETILNEGESENLI